MKAKTTLATFGCLLALAVFCFAPQQAYALLHQGGAENPLILQNSLTGSDSVDLEVFVYSPDDQDLLPDFFVDKGLVLEGEVHLYTYRIENTDGQPILTTALLLDPESTQFVQEIGSISGTVSGFVAPSGDYNFIYYAGWLSPGDSDTYYVIADTEPVMGLVSIDFPNGDASGMVWVPDCPDWWWHRNDPPPEPDGVPEPGTLLLLGSALIGMAGIRRLYTRK